MLLIITYVLKYHLSGEALTDLLQLINLHCAASHPGLQSIHVFFKYFQKLQNPLVFHHYCSSCLFKLDDPSVVICPNDVCHNDLSKHGAKSFFIEIPIEAQLQSLFSRGNFYDDLAHRFRRKKKHQKDIADIYDGSLYQRHFVNNGILSHQENISLMWNTDGVPVFKSSSYSLWPLYLTINELPLDKRTKNENMLFAGLWFGSSKPQMLTYLQPFHSTFDKLEREGVAVETATGQSFRSKVILICGTCDLPAKSLVCNMIQFNGFYGCVKCLQPGKTVTTAKGGHVHVFPFIKEDATGPKRTHEQFLEDAKSAFDSGRPVHGVKGPCWFGTLKHYDIVAGCGIDYMHCVLQGVVKTLFSLWFTTETSDMGFNISRKISEVDARLLEIQPPNEITRCPRSIETHRKYWKASEIRSFLMYYGMAVLFGILPQMYYEHFVLLSQGIFILALESISDDQLHQADYLLRRFCLEFPILYGERYMSHNIHTLLHLVDDVKVLGPLWTHSCFHFEDKNGFLLKLIHGTQKVELQIITAVALVQRLPQMVQKLEMDVESSAFYKKMTRPFQRRSNEVSIVGDIYRIGSPVTCTIDEQIFSLLTKSLGFVPIARQYCKYVRLRIGATIYHSKAYKRVFKRNSYTVIFKQEDIYQYGMIEYFMQVKPQCLCSDPYICDCQSRNFALIEKLQGRDDIDLLDGEHNLRKSTFHISVVSPPSNDFIIVDVTDILAKCICMNFQDIPDLVFIGHFPNRIESD
ncbi:uncharacterized protein [Ptychodera flava]|uniref:uncharacterized protein n=1 Tax=Ptychodera flava TaxID=63121 RepID=UPI003969DB3D